MTAEQCLTGRASPVSDNIWLPGFTLPASRKVTANEGGRHHRGRQASVQRTSHVRLLSLQEPRLFILCVAFCSLVVPTGDRLGQGQLHKAAQEENIEGSITCLVSSWLLGFTVSNLHNICMFLLFSFISKTFSTLKYRLFPNTVKIPNLKPRLDFPADKLNHTKI